MTILATLSNFAVQILAQAATPVPETSAPAAGGAAPAQSGGGGLFGGGMSWILIYVLLFGGMYFLMIAPQRKKQKAMQKMISEIDAGDQIITSSGIFGEITNRKDDRFVVRIADGVKIEIAKGFVQTVVKKKDGGEAKS